MKTILFLISILLAMLLTSCATQSVYLQELSVDGPQSKPPLFITNDNKQGDVRIVPKISVSNSQTLEGRAQGHSNVNTSGRYRVDTVNDNGTIRYFERNGDNTKPFEQRNFRWEPPKMTASVNFEYVAARTLSLVLGASYSSGGSQSFLGAITGIGFFFESNNLAARIDIGAQWSTSSYDVNYVVTTTPFSFGSRETEVAFFHEKGKATFANAYGAFTVNTKAPAWPVQGFLQLAIKRQTLVNIDKRTAFSDNAVVLQSTSFFIVTPGLYFDISPQTRIVAGVHLGDETELLEADPGVLVVPFLQFEFGM